MKQVFQEITDQQLQMEVDRTPCSVCFETMEKRWGVLEGTREHNPRTQLYRYRPTMIRVRIDLTNEQKIATLIHELEHARDLMVPSPLSHLEDMARAEAAAYRGCLNELLKRGLYLPLLWEMYAIEWDAEGEGQCIRHGDAALAVYSSPLWERCRESLLEAMNRAPPPMHSARVNWKGHGNAKLLDTGRPLLVVEQRGGKIVDFVIVKEWSPESGGAPKVDGPVSAKHRMDGRSLT